MPYRSTRRPAPGPAHARSRRLAPLLTLLLILSVATAAALAQAVPLAAAPEPPGRGMCGPSGALDLDLDWGRYYVNCRARQGFQDLAVDDEGNAVAVGFIPQFCDREPSEVLLIRYTADGTEDVLHGFSDHLGGHFEDVPNGVALDADGNIYIAGATTSDRSRRPFPVVAPFQEDNAGPLGTADAFVMKLDPTGQTILYSTFLGGEGDDRATDVALDARGRIYVAGVTDSADFPTASPLQALPGGGEDAFVAVLTPDGSALAFSTYFGGTGDDRATRLAVRGRHVFLTGATASPDLPTRVPGAGRGAAGLAESHQGGARDAFVARIDRLARLGYAGYLGGAGDDAGYGIAVDATGFAHVAGTTDSADFPTAGALQGSLAAPPEADAFLTRLVPSGARAAYSTYLDVEGTAACETAVSDLRTWYCAGVAVTDGGTAFVTATGRTAIAVDRQGRRVLDSLDLVGGTSIELGPGGGVYVAGATSNDELPFTPPVELVPDSVFEEAAWLARVTPACR